MKDDAISQVQASWRFFNNSNVTTKKLFQPIADTLKSKMVQQCNKFVLTMSDWLYLDYKKHISKSELKSENIK